ncbi:FAD-dependent monooxygenase [Solicola gregarius]|uniref:FAD-dependent monooxygenase n=1 Tax=Solicola gregarius TaxID=2908642 RepID=A0AA46YJF8_9ACTN|nr:FAD-dependent monooxygenase [Solicola gregarius]UYM03431.1 FAD-dependent monooxygenase [Solicola gregarius]
MTDGRAHDDAVVVVGNGPVGQSASLLLARWGLRVITFDERPERDYVGSRSICQQRDVLDIWDSVGAGRQVADEGVTWTTARTFHRDLELFALTFEDRGRSRFPPFVNISQSRTERILDTALGSQPLVDARWAHCVTGIRPDAGGVTVVGTSPVGPFELRATYVVMCAGGHCDDLRESLGIEFYGHSYADRFLICDIRTELPDWRTERRFYFDPRWNPGRQVLIHPCPDSTYRIDWQVDETYDLDEERRSGALDRRIRQIVGDAAYEIVWCSVYRAHERIADRMSAGRVLLAGDCAHLVTPFGARGLNSGVQDAENAAWKIAYASRGYASPALVRTYDDERHAAAVENLTITSATMDFLAPETPEQIAYRRVTLDDAGADPSARARVDSGRLAEPFWYVDSPLTTLDPSRTFEGRPPKGFTPAPAPGILLPDVPARYDSVAIPLRSLAREHLTVLTGADVDATSVSRAVRAMVSAPVRVMPVAAIEDSMAAITVSEALGIQADEIWLLRPDAYVAAVVRDAEELLAAAARLLAR